MARYKKNEMRFVEGVTALGKELGVPPIDALELFGVIARRFIDHVHERGESGMTHDELITSALRSYAGGLGLKLADVSIKPLPDDLH